MAHPGSFLGHFGAIRGRLGPVVHPAWVNLVPLGGILGPSGDLLGPRWEHFGVMLGPSWSMIWGMLTSLGVISREQPSLCCPRYA